MVEIGQKVDSLAWEVMGIKSWGMTSSQILVQEETKGGIGVCVP